jgi:hypothetical protein
MLMIDTVKSWFRENNTLVYFLIAQAIAIGTVGVSIIAYSVRLESRVSTLEIRGSPHLQVIDNRLVVLESLTRSNKESLDRIVNTLTKDVR